jgi:hypothetical protein
MTSEALIAAELRALRERLERLERLETPRRVAARARSSGGQSVAHNSAVVVDFNDIVFDDLGCITTGASWQFRAPAAGIYHVATAVLFAASTEWSVGETANIQIWRNGTTISIPDRMDLMPPSSVYAHLGGSDLISLAAGDLLRIAVYQATGIALPIYSGGDAALYSFVAIHKL